MKNGIPETRHIEEIAAHLEVLGNPTRLRILFALSNGEQCVAELADFLEMSMPAISHHLRILRDKRLITSRSEGNRVYYSLIDACILAVLKTAQHHVLEEHG